jgi:tetratricopeptide (TPR) repeat protein
VGPASEGARISARIFDATLRTGNLKDAISRYETYRKQYKNLPLSMHYALGKALFDAGLVGKASNLLRLIPKGNELYIRARYLMATSGIDKRSAKESIKLYKLIEDSPAVSVEDHALKQMAILAQARIYLDANRDDLAAKTYERVLLTGPVGETATIEVVRTLISRAEQALYNEGKFARLSEPRRKRVEALAIQRAMAAIDRYRKVTEIDWRKPELHTLMSFLLVKSGRYDEARLAYAELIEHYRPIYQRLMETEAENASVWPYFKLDFEDRPSKKPLMADVPEALLKDIPELSVVVRLKHRIEESGRRLSLLLEGSASLLDNQNLELAKANHKTIVKEYESLVKSEQNNINKISAEVINKTLAEAEYRRAELALLEMRDLKKQLDVAREFQTKKITDFEDELPELNQGGSL